MKTETYQKFWLVESDIRHSPSCRRLYARPSTPTASTVLIWFNYVMPVVISNCSLSTYLYRNGTVYERERHLGMPEKGAQLISHISLNLISRIHQIWAVRNPQSLVFILKLWESVRVEFILKFIEWHAVK